MKKLNIFLPLLFFILCLIPALLGSDNRIDNGLILQREVETFQQTLLGKMDRMKKSMEEIARLLDRNAGVNDIWEKLGIHEGHYTKEGESYLISKNDTLLYWSDNSCSFTDSLHRFSASPESVFLGNAWFVKMSMKSGNYVITGLLLIKYDYPIENRFLENKFQDDFRFSKEVRIGYLKDVLPGSYIVKGPANERLFFLHSSQLIITRMSILSYPWLWYLLALAFFLFAIREIFKSLSRGKIRLYFFLGLVLFFVTLRTVMILWHIPAPAYNLDLFHPKYFASSAWLPSLGDLILTSIVIFFMVYNFYREIPLELTEGKSFKDSGWIKWLSLIALAAYTIYPDMVFKTLVENSRISFEAHNLLDLSRYNFLALIPVALLYASAGLLMDKWVVMTRKHLDIRKMMIYFSLSMLVIFALMNLLGPGYDPLTLALLLIVFGTICVIRFSGVYQFRYSTFLMLILLFAIYSAFFSAHYAGNKIREEQKVLAMNLADEHDAVAELLLDEVEKRIENDRTLQGLIYRPDFHFEDLYNYLGKRYFTDYWLKYDYQVTICTETDTVFIRPDNIRAHCYSFFEDLVRERGIEIPNTDLYYLDNRNGRISYFASIPFEKNKREVTLFIQLDSKLVSESLGYPELLLADEVSRENPLSGYSYAKYYDGQLIMKSGLFPYSLTSKSFEKKGQEFYYMTGEKYDHLIYQVDRKNLIVLSRPIHTFFDRLVAFSYVFLFYFALATLILLFSKVPFIQVGFRATLKNRIQYSMIILLFLSLLLVGGGSVYFSIRQYHSKHSEILSEKMQSVYAELMHEVGYQKKLKPDWHSNGYDSLEELLKKFSNVFYTDINLYTEQGDLMASSRPEIFTHSLTGKKMNPVSYHELSVNRRAEFIHQEQIGNMSYLSAYVPFVNNDNKFLAYLNLPYFTRQTLLSEEVSSLVVAVVNISMLLILLSTAFTIFIANQITRPLSMLQEKFSEIELGKRYEMVNYEGKDEVGSLVKEYNRMVEELERNVELLARSERETAWREMAKQVAHEIKNPLTPMKLSVQHLERAWDHKSGSFEEYLKKFIKTITEQIDNLSYIANAFSNFAMMPGEKNERMDFLEVVKNTVNLFSNQENIEITINYHDLERAWVFGDKEQLVRLLVNLFKNAIQSIPEDRKGKIRVGLKQSGDYYVFMISDNGTGIPENLRNRMFEPNFTTKSSGMGLGLAMSKKIVENTGGTITYETAETQGTTFFVSLPVKD